MRKLFGLVLLVALAGAHSMADEITFTFVNLSQSTFQASPAFLAFGNANNVLVTDNTSGQSVMLLGTDSGFTGGSTAISFSPTFLATYNSAGPGSVVVSGFLTGSMNAGGEFESTYPKGAGAFSSDFTVGTINPAVFTDLGLSAKTAVASIGSVSLTVAQANLTGSTLNAVLGGGSISIETLVPVPEPSTLLLVGVSLVGLASSRVRWLRRQRRPARPSHAS